MPKIAQDDVNRDTTASERKPDLTEVTREAGEKAADAAREGSRFVRAAAADTREAAREAGERAAEATRDSARFVRAAAADASETARHSAEAATDAGRTFVEILGEQARANMQAAGALARAVNWSEVVEIQRDFTGESFARMNRLGECYRRLFQVGATSVPPAFKQ